MLTASRFGAIVSATVLFAVASWPAAAAPLLNGVAVHTELGKEQFIAGLYADSPTDDAATLLSSNQNKRIQVRVLADALSSRRFKRMWIEGIAINSSHADLQDNAQHMADFSNMLRVKLMQGDILTIDRDAQAGMTISLNGTSLGTIDDPQFFDLLLRTWIGSVPLSSSFRDNLLKSGAVATDLLTRFEATRPSDERIASVERAISASKQEKLAQNAAQAKPELVADAVPKEPLIDAPQLEKPALAMAPPALGPEKPSIAAPAASKPAQKEAAKPAPAPKPAPAETQVAKASKKAETEENIFEDEQEESFTAASLLSRQLYIGKVKSWAQRELKYPDRALRREWQGNVRLDITLDRKGNLVDVAVSEEAEYSVLTKEALRAVEEAAPFPPMPDDVAGNTFLFTMPVAFKLQ